MENNNTKNKTSKVQNNKLRLAFVICLILFLCSLAVLVVSMKNQDFAQYYSNTISAFFRKLLSSVTGFIPFSLAEIVVLLSPVLVILLVVFVVRVVKGKTKLSSFLFTFFTAVLVLGTLFINTFAVCYFRYPLEKSMSLNRKALSREEIFEIAFDLKLKVEEACLDVTFAEDGSSINPHNWKKLNSIIDNGYEALRENYKFITNINSPSKKILLSPIMTYSHISGIYIPFTGEANVNTNYPDYVVAFTVAHEKAHQRGIAGEDEANFLAFLSCVYSNDSYLKYFGLMSMYDYFLDSLYENDEEMYKYMVENTDKTVLKEMYSYYMFFKKYQNSKVSQVADTVNDSYLKSMGQDEGVKSYGRVIELYYAYAKK